MYANTADQRYHIEHDTLEELITLFNHFHLFDHSTKELFPKTQENVRENAEILLRQMPQDQEKRRDQKRFVVRSLGKVSEREDSRGEQHKQSIMGTAQTLAALSSSFSMTYIVDERGARFEIGIDKDSEEKAYSVLQRCLRGGFGQAFLESAPQVYSPQYRASARLNLVLQDKNIQDQPLSTELLGSWADELAAALPEGEGAMTIEFVPIKREWIAKKSDRLCQAADLLTEMAETSWQVSSGTNTGMLVNGMITEEFLKKIQGDRKNNDSDSLNVSLSTTFRRSAFQMAGKEIEYALEQLEHMKRAGGFSVSITARAEDRETLAVMEAVMAGALSRAGLSVYWENWSGIETPPISILLEGQEVYRLARFPERNFPGFRRVENENYELTTYGEELRNGTLELGTIRWNDQKLNRSFLVPIQELNRHTFVCGMTGSGKTNTMCHLLTKIGLPFLVIEPVKGEYRSLVGSLPNTEVYTMTAGSKEMLPINPFWFPPQSSLQYHIDSLKTVISSAFDLYAAMPNILEQCLIRVYVNLGWDLVSSKNAYEGKLPEDMLYPIFSDLCTEIEHYLESSDFEGEARANYKGAMLSRLQSFTTGAKGLLLNGTGHPPFQRWFEERENVILELDALADDADKCIVMGTILAQYFQFVKYCVKGEEDHKLRHAIVVEEAHHLFMADTQSQNGSYAQKQLVETLSNLMAEIRAYGEGFFIVDQSPSRISEEVIKNSGTKIVHRVDFGKDIETLRPVLLLEEKDQKPASLEKGCALVRYGNMEKPAKVYVPICEVKEKFVLNRTETFDGKTINHARSTVDTMLMNPIFAEELKWVCGLFVNQAFFDGMSGIRNSIKMLWAQCSSIICSHGYQELVLSCQDETFFVLLAMRGVTRYLEDAYIEQPFFHRIAKLYLKRLLDFETTSQSSISQKEELLFLDFRSAQIQDRLSAYYMYHTDASLVDIRRNCGATMYGGLLKEIITRLWESKEIQLILKDHSKEELDHVISKYISALFYQMPEKPVLIELVRYLKQYIKSKSDIGEIG